MHKVFLIYFGIPSGAVWSNVLAEPLCVVLGFLAAFPLRHKIGKTLAAWWHKHHGPHLAATFDERLAVMKGELLAEMKEHFGGED
jgi:hypothetical protein